MIKSRKNAGAKGNEKMISYITGALGIAANVLIYQQKSGKKLLMFKLISDILWVAHYFSLQANAAAAIAAINIFREIVFYNKDKKWAKGKSWIVFFVACSIASAIFTWKSAFSILPATASILAIISFRKGDPHLSRNLAFPISACMLTYDIFCGSVMGIVNETFTLVSAAVGKKLNRKTAEQA